MTTHGKRALVVYPHLPHYRLGVFRELDKDPEWEFVFAADLRSRDNSIATIEPSLLRSTVVLRNKWLRGWLWQRGLLRQITESDWDAVIFLGDAAYISTWVAGALARLRGVRVYFWTIGWHRPDTGVKRHVRRLFYAIPNVLLLYGRDARDIGIDMGVATDRISIVGNSTSSWNTELVKTGIARDTEWLDEVSRGEGPVIGAVVRLTYGKRLDLLVRAASLMAREYPDVTVLLVGEGPARLELENLAHTLGVRLIAPGALYGRDALESVYERLTVTVLPERAGLTTIQSLQHGRPVVTVDDPLRQVPEFRAVVQGVTGGLYARGDIESLKSSVVEWIDRVRAAPQEVTSNCRREAAMNWSARANAEHIVSQLSRDVAPANGVPE